MLQRKIWANKKNMRANKLKRVQTCFTSSSLTSTIYHYCPLWLGNITLSNWRQTNWLTPNALERIFFVVAYKKGSKEFTVGGGSQPFGHSGARLDDTTSHPIMLHYNQARHGDRKISLISLYSYTAVQRGVILQNSNDIIGMNPLLTIGGIRPHVNKKGIFNLFNPIKGITNFSNRRM